MAANKLWKDKSIQQVYGMQDQYHLLDCAK